MTSGCYECNVLWCSETKKKIIADDAGLRIMMMASVGKGDAATVVKKGGELEASFEYFKALFVSVDDV